MDVGIVPGKGPVMGQAVRTADDVARLTEIDPASLDVARSPHRKQ